MELQFNQTACQCLRQAVWEVKEQEQTQEVRLPDAMPDIGKVLGAWGQPLIRSKEWRGDGMTVSGGVMVWILYAPEDGTSCRSVDAWIPFQIRWDFPQTQHDGSIRAACQLRSADARSTSARKLMARVNVSVMGEAVEPWEAEISTPGEIPEDVELLKKTYPITLPREAGEKAFVVEEEVQLPASAPAVEKILRYCLQPEIIDQKVMAGKVVFRGEAAAHVLYRAQDESLQTWDFRVPFSQYTDLEREYSSEATAKVTPALTSLELEAGEEGQLRLKAGVTGQYTVFDRQMMEIVEDAYSPRRAVTVQTQTLTLPALLESRTEDCRCEGRMEAEASQIVDMAYYPETPRLHTGENGGEVELTGTFQALYLDPEGNPRCGTAHSETRVPFPLDRDCRVEAVAWPSGWPQGTVSGGIDLRNEAVLELDTKAQQGFPMVTSLELGEVTEPDPARPSLILCRAGEGGLWELAKRSGATVEAIRKANHLTDEPPVDQLLLVPVM